MTEVHLHLLRGDDAYSISMHCKAITASLGTDFNPDMNTTRLDGRTATLEDIQTAVATLPFFGTSRLVIVDSVLAKIDKSRQEKFTAMLSSIPPSTHLVLIEEDTQRWKKEDSRWQRIWATLSPSHWLIKAFSSLPLAEIIDLPLPDEKSMPGWIIAETRRQGGMIDTDAAQELGRHIGNHTSIASQEITKLLTFVDFKRQVTRNDVLELVSDEGSADVFNMLDRLMLGNTSQAQAMMHRILDDTQPEIVLGAVIYRFRQLIMVREALDAGEDPRELVKKQGIFSNQLDNYIKAARRYSMKTLEMIHHRLLEMDLQAKNSQVDLATNLELLILEAG